MQDVKEGTQSRDDRETISPSCCISWQIIHVSGHGLLWNCSLYLAQTGESAARAPSERKQCSTVSKLEGIQCGLASGLAPCPFLSAVTLNKACGTSKAGEVPLRKELQPLSTSCKYINPVEVGSSPLVCTCLQTVEGGTADSAPALPHPPPPPAHSYPSNKIPSKKWWNWLYSWDDVRKRNLWPHKVTDWQICVPGKHRSLTISLVVLPFFLFFFAPDSLGCSFVVAPCFPDGLDQHAKNSNHQFEIFFASVCMCVCTVTLEIAFSKLYAPCCIFFCCILFLFD